VFWAFTEVRPWLANNLLLRTVIKCMKLPKRELHVSKHPASIRKPMTSIWERSKSNTYCIVGPVVISARDYRKFAEEHDTALYDFSHPKQALTTCA